MSYFSHFPKKFQPDSTTPEKIYRKVTNILKRIAVRNNFVDDKTLFYKYLVKDGDTPESLSMKLYGKPDYHWIIWIINKHINPYFDWPMSYDELNSYIRDKYPGKTLRLSPNTVVFEFGASSLHPDFFHQGTLENLGSASGGTSNVGTATILRFESDNTINSTTDFLFVNNVTGTWTKDSNIRQDSNTTSSTSRITTQGGFEVGNSIFQPSTGARGSILDWNADLQQIVVEPLNNIPFEVYTMNVAVYDVLVEEETGKLGLLQHSLGSYSPVVDSTDAVHHFIDADGYQVSRDTDSIASLTSENFEPDGQGPVTNRTYEYDQNDETRGIYLLKPIYVKEFVNKFEKSLLPG